LNKIQRVVAPVRGQVQDLLRIAIEKGDLAPGDRLIERELCEALGVSRPLVREALRKLESDGLARPLPRGGLAVTVLSRSEAMQIYTVRKEVEGLAASLFVEAAEETQRNELAQTIATLKSSHANGESENVLKAKNRFYAILSEGSGNIVLQEILHNIHGRIRLLRGTSLSKPGRTEKMVYELSSIAEAIANKDAAEARRLTEVHITNAMSATNEALAERESLQKPFSIDVIAPTIAD
tara:strand:- start:2990 stop:3703 length:714 start_codon:yes stop_codon:yes gene_type:complete